MGRNRQLVFREKEKARRELMKKKSEERMTDEETIDDRISNVKIAIRNCEWDLMGVFKGNETIMKKLENQKNQLKELERQKESESKKDSEEIDDEVSKQQQEDEAKQKETEAEEQEEIYKQQASEEAKKENEE